MFVTVIEVLPGDVNAVRCQTSEGLLTARWRGDAPPALNVAEHVELDTVGRLTWGSGLAVINPDGVSEYGEMLTGVVEDIEGDVVTARVGEGLVLLDVEGDPPLGALGKAIRITPAAFEIWPTGL
jgi:hypothetical protein